MSSNREYKIILCKIIVTKKYVQNKNKYNKSPYTKDKMNWYIEISTKYISTYKWIIASC